MHILWCFALQSVARCEQYNVKPKVFHVVYERKAFLTTDASTASIAPRTAHSSHPMSFCVSKEHSKLQQCFIHRICDCELGVKSPWRISVQSAHADAGKLYHYMAALVLPEGRSPSFMYVYIHNMDYTKQLRICSRPDLNQDLLGDFTQMLYEVHQYVQSFPCLRDWETSAKTQPASYKMVIHAHIGPYKVPETSEIATILSGKGGGEVGRCDNALR